MIGDELAVAWLSLAATTGDDEDLQLVPLSVGTPVGAVCAGRDRVGRAHLLVPAPVGTRVVPDHRSAAVDIRERELILEGRRQVFLDLWCRQSEAEEVFARLALEVCERVAGEPAAALSIPGLVLRSWRRLLAAWTGELNQDRAAGLFGELHVLGSSIRVDPSRRVDHWQRNGQARHDFVRGGVAVEVKSTTAREGRTVEIHGVEQLDPPAGGSLHLAFLRLAVGPEGRTIGEMVASLSACGADGAALSDVLADMGWTGDGPDAPRFAVVEERWYLVDGRFPRLVPSTFAGAALPDGVLRLRYSVDLSGQAPAPVTEGQRLDALRALAAG